MATDPAFALVMSQLRAGDQDAATLIFRQFARRLIALASGYFDARFRAKEDPEDVVLSVYKSFFRREKGSPFDLSDWDGLWALLAKITVNKCINRRKFWQAGVRDVGREFAPGSDLMAESWCDAIDRGPTSFQALVLAETLEQLTRRFEPPQRAIAELSFQGYTAPEIAARCDCSERTVRRVVARIGERLREIDATGRED